MNNKVTLIIMDGYGINPSTNGNAISEAKKPNLDKIFATCPNTLIEASGMDVGLPKGQMGNSEVGHTNIGAGRVVYQELTRITKSIEDGDFFTNPSLVFAMDNCKKNNSALHLFGLLSDGGVHSHDTHIYALLKMAKDFGLSDVFVHCLMDGRDVSPTSGAGYINDLQKQIDEIGVGAIATVAGRYYGMDRDNQWTRVEKAYAAMVYGEGEKVKNAADYVTKSYENKVTDEFIVPAVIDGGKIVCANDSVICFNFRPDRVRELTRTFVDPAFNGFERKRGFLPLCFICMTEYDKTMPNVKVAFEPDSLFNTFGEYISGLGLKQLRIAETTKYAHVTFFFNGGTEKSYPGEDRALMPTPDVATFDLMPQMSAYKIADEVVERINSKVYDAIIMNYANCDMVGHSGLMEATIKAVEAVDECVGKTVDAVLKNGGIAIITADHGNADKLIDSETGGVFTAHSTNPVPFIVIGKDVKLRKGGRLCDIAPTMLDLMGVPKPKEMTGISLIEG